ncbi:MAG TPA: ABC transporter substrate-binding protein [Verrucomicrobiae bacterium]|jgi:ABC-type nitrate/sulfonate/bicarbonate transport system substrate-binding protein|nr:ABC transporter substrate-binding protein [Verrucomicrobiae bacterium]
MKRRSLLILITLISLAAGLGLSPQSSVAAEHAIIGTPSRGLFEFPVVVALKKGFYRDEGLAVDKVQMQPAIGVKALVSGDIDYLLAWGSTLRAAVTGVPLKVVAGMASRPLHVFVVRGGIKSGKELKGKTIGVDSFAGTVDYLARMTVRYFGLDPDKDVKIIVSGESPVRLAAVRAGSIDATAIDVAFAVKAEEEGMSRLLNLSDISDLPLSGIGLSDKKLHSEREQVKKVVRATLRGTRFMKDNRAETLALMADYLHITPAQAAKAYDAAINSFTDDGYISDQGVLLDMQLTKERLKITKDIPLSQVVDWSVLKEIKAGAK